MVKIGLLADVSLSDFVLKALDPILLDNNFLIKVAIIDTRPKLTLKQKLKSNLKRRRGAYIFVMALKSFFSKKKKGFSTVDFCRKHTIEIIEIIETNSLYSQTIIENIRKYDLDLLVLVSGFGILKEPILKATPLGVLSYHHGDMRRYRGMPPALWELYNNEKEMGITVQILSTGIDCGIPVLEKKLEVKKKDTVKNLQERALDESVPMLYSALLKVSNKDFRPKSIDALGKVYTLPNLKQWIILNFRLLWRRLK
jgi:folate-dependent phosphoribosylglycinamide formyltransferase PurN